MKQEILHTIRVPLFHVVTTNNDERYSRTGKQHARLTKAVYLPWEFFSLGIPK